MDINKLVPEAGNLAGFIEQFEVFASAPGGVAKLKEIILQLAFHGALQKSEKKQENNNSDLHSIPSNWEWCKLSTVTNFFNGFAFKSTDYLDSGVGIIRIGDISFDGEISAKNMKYVNENLFKKLSVNYRVNPSDLVIAMSGATTGKLGFNNTKETFLLNQRVGKFEFTGVNSFFCFYYLSTKIQENLAKSKGMAIPNLSTKQIKEIYIPIPPLEEQKRIVAKVDELMALCDKLEAQQQQQANNVLRANTAAINALLNPVDPKASFEQNWQRIAQHFNTLYGCTLPMPKGEGRKKKHLVGLENVKALRQAILKLSVKGKLTQTRPEDGSADKLLEIINTGIDAKKYKKLSRLTPPEELFSLPDKWVWSSFWRVADIQSNLVKPDLYGDMPHIAPNHIEKDNGVLLEYSTILADGVKSNKHYFYSGQILYSKIRPNLNKLTLIDFEGLCSADMYPIRAKINTHFLCLYMLSSYFVEQTIADDNRVAMPKVNQERLNSISVPVPPLEEQKRIVTKVDQLMTLCDQLEQQLTQSYSDAENLMQATVKALVA